MKVPNYVHTSSRIENVTAKLVDLFRPTFFFRPKPPKVAIIKTKSATIASFFCPPFYMLLAVFLFLLSFFFVRVILELIRPKKLAFWRLFTQMTANFVRLVFENSAKHTYTQALLSIYCIAAPQGGSSAIYKLSASRLLTLSLPNLIKTNCDQISKFHFVKSWTTNSTLWK